jgi:hypothetical protein
MDRPPALAPQVLTTSPSRTNRSRASPLAGSETRLATQRDSRAELPRCTTFGAMFSPECLLAHRGAATSTAPCAGPRAGHVGRVTACDGSSAPPCRRATRRPHLASHSVGATGKQQESTSPVSRACTATDSIPTRPYACGGSAKTAPIRTRNSAPALFAQPGAWHREISAPGAQAAYPPGWAALPAMAVSRRLRPPRRNR